MKWPFCSVKMCLKGECWVHKILDVSDESSPAHWFFLPQSSSRDRQFLGSAWPMKCPIIISAKQCQMAPVIHSNALTRIFMNDLWYLCLFAVASAAAFKAGKIQNNPFSQGSAAGGAAIPPPANLAGRFCCTCYLPYYIFSIFFSRLPS